MVSCYVRRKGAPYTQYTQVQFGELRKQNEGILRVCSFVPTNGVFLLRHRLLFGKGFLLRLYIGVYPVALSFPRLMVILLLYILRGTVFPFFSYFSFSTPFLRSLIWALLRHSPPL